MGGFIQTKDGHLQDRQGGWPPAGGVQTASPQQGLLRRTWEETDQGTAQDRTSYVNLQFIFPGSSSPQAQDVSPHFRVCPSSAFNLLEFRG